MHKYVRVDDGELDKTVGLGNVKEWGCLWLHQVSVGHDGGI